MAKTKLAEGIAAPSVTAHDVTYSHAGSAANRKEGRRKCGGGGDGARSQTPVAEHGKRVSTPEPQRCDVQL